MVLGVGLQSSLRDFGAKRDDVPAIKSLGYFHTPLAGAVGSWASVCGTQAQLLGLGLAVVQRTGCVADGLGRPSYLEAAAVAAILASG
jgi:hypothetical protein